MRSVLFFDLPMITKKEIREYNKFLKLIKKNGFVMLQKSVYTKLSLNQKVADSTLSIIKKNVPNDGVISVLNLTEQQFSNIIQLLGNVTTDVIMSTDKIIEL